MAKDKKQTLVTELDYKEVEALVCKEYGHCGLDEYSFVATEECGNDEVFLFTVRDTGVVLDPLTKGSGNYEIMEHLCVDGHLAPGKYLVRVSW